MGAAFIDEAIKAGKTVLVHCHAGVGRSTLLCTCYLIYAGMNAEEAWQTVKTHRPVAYLNPRQLAALEDFTAEIEQERSATSVPVEGPEPEEHLFVEEGVSDQS